MPASGGSSGGTCGFLCRCRAPTEDMSWHGFVKPNTWARANMEWWDTRKTQTYAGEQLEDKNPCGDKRKPGCTKLPYGTFSFVPLPKMGRSQEGQNSPPNPRKELFSPIGPGIYQICKYRPFLGNSFLKKQIRKCLMEEEVL